MSSNILGDILGLGALGVGSLQTDAATQAQRNAAMNSQLSAMQQAGMQNALGGLGQQWSARPVQTRPIDPVAGSPRLLTRHDAEMAEWTRKHAEAKAAADKGVIDLIVTYRDVTKPT